MYSLMWIVATPVIWQALAVWQKTIVPPYLGVVASTIGAALVFPGAGALDFGTTSLSPPFVTGLSAVFIIWVCAPIVAVSITGIGFLNARNLFARGDDPLHKTLWVQPVVAWGLCLTCGLMMMYTVGSPRGTTASQTTPQSTCILLAAASSVACIAVCLAMPFMSQRLLRRRAPVAIKRMSLVGLDEATVKELRAEEVTGGVQGWLQRAYTGLIQPDLFEDVRSSDTLMRIHSTAEEFDASAEELWAPFQVVLCAFLSLAYGANNAHTSFAILATLRSLHSSGVVPESANLGIWLRCVSALGAAIGTLLLGQRLAPITGVGMAKMTPFRSYIVTSTVAAETALLGTVQLKGGVITYIMVSAVAAVGIAEGVSHVNWRLLAKILLWWVAGFCLTMVATSALIAQEFGLSADHQYEIAWLE
ncbi:TPA: Na+/Pi symporter, variant 2 [Trebouxia sp. C0006]